MGDMSAHEIRPAARVATGRRTAPGGIGAVHTQGAGWIAGCQAGPRVRLQIQRCISAPVMVLPLGSVTLASGPKQAPAIMRIIAASLGLTS